MQNLQKEVCCEGISQSTHWPSSPKRIVGTEEPIMMLQQNQDARINMNPNLVNL